ncbi:pantoate--beta-alanine ligase [Roseibacillus ishigakijimensis]|uniref:Pantothenate synthetase n=1 Tax=Roseibacillus ishigakijimensis TaxID=454146 RepID=A0A934RRB3_9BACT|nr:pantoate--beta-alanine ligase [Roseibacillus ishigakijimensis]MBK1833106.1 pantoate--beta-alanine ligase [Roseibacillus ishigakijimensis]
MTTSTSSADLRAERAHWSRPVAFVPTMGALHEGHLSLFQQARAAVGEKGHVVASIFVNPLQFDRPEDLQSYPRTLSEDLELCQKEGVDHVFCPRGEDFYAPDHSIQVLESRLARHLCGATRPGHFDGVCTVVLKLFNLVQPTCAIFGKKDYQQLAIIRRLVRDLSVPIEIIGAETFREKDGLALSSRNRNLSPADRADAPRLRRALLAGENLAVTGERSPQKYLAAAHAQLQEAPASFRLDYLELVSRATLQPLASVNEPALLAIAAFYGPVRLIDNIEVDAR